MESHAYRPISSFFFVPFILFIMLFLPFFFLYPPVPCPSKPSHRKTQKKMELLFCISFSPCDCLAGSRGGGGKRKKEEGNKGKKKKVINKKFNEIKVAQRPDKSYLLFLIHYFPSFGLACLQSYHHQQLIEV